MSDNYIVGVEESTPCKYRSPYIPLCYECPPVRIEITVLPDKMVYEGGESIDLTGIVVRAFKANGNLWGGFPHGIIPIAQLTYEPTTARAIEAGACEDVFNLGATIYDNSEVIYRPANQNYAQGFRSQDHSVHFAVAGLADTLYYASDTVPIVFERGSAAYSEMSWSTVSLDESYTFTYDNKTVYGGYIPVGDWNGYRVTEGVRTDLQTLDLDVRKKLSWCLVYAHEARDEEITVSWTYENQTFTDTFDITIA